MERNICPYLGLPDDNQTRMAFPSEGNLCHKAQPPASIAREHQSGFCLSSQHIACPVFLAQVEGLRSGKETSALPAVDCRKKKLHDAVLLAIGIMLWLGGAWAHGTNLVSGMMALGGPFVRPAALLPDNLPDQYPYPQLGPPAQPSERGSILPGPDPSPAQAQTIDCPPPPQDWTSIIIQPTDSIYRLSILYGASVEDLQAANCMGSQTYLAPGTTLHVPEFQLAARPSAYIPSGIARMPARSSSSSPSEDQSSPTVDVFTSNPVSPASSSNSEQDKKEEDGKNKKDKDDEKKDDKEDKDDDKKEEKRNKDDDKDEDDEDDKEDKDNDNDDD